MAIDLLRRRAQLQAKLDKYEGCEFGITVVRVIVEFPPCLLPLVEIPSNCTSLTLKHNIPSANVSAMIMYEGDEAKNNFTTTSVDTRTYAIVAGAYTHARCLINLDYIDDCYLKDNTNNTYLWKGKNVT